MHIKVRGTLRCRREKQAELLGFGVGAFLRRRGAGRGITTAGPGVKEFYVCR